MKTDPHGRLKCDVLVVGGGGAGALAAVEAAKDEKLRILLLSKGPIGMSGLTPTANGGTAGAGSEEDLFKLMITAGRFLNDQEVAWFMVTEIKNSLKRLSDMGIPVVPLRARSVCVQSTETLRRLRSHIVRSPNIELREEAMVTRLFTSKGRIAGAAALDLITGELFAVEASAVVLATGGSAGELYPHTSNNPFGVSTDATGTGHVMAYRAGADLVDMEMIQFVPLGAIPRGLYIRYFPEFWAGPYRNRSGEVVEGDISQYPAASYAAELVRKLFLEIRKGNGPLYVDQRASEAIDSKLLIKAWEQRRHLIRSLGIDPRQNRIEIVLGSHFSMGGVKVNAKTETTVPGLFAPGEIMGAVHGACRLSGYSFSQMIVFGFEAGKQAAAYARQTEGEGPVSEGELEEEEKHLRRYLEPKAEPLSVHAVKDRLKQVMEEHVFVVRDADGLKEAVRKIDAIEEDMIRIQVPSLLRFNLEWKRAIEFPFMVDAARIATLSALAREESRGSHYRSDFPYEDNGRWLCHTLARCESGRPTIGTFPVELPYLRPEECHA